MQKETLLLSLPFVGLVVLVIVLYVPQFLKGLTFMDKTTILLTFALASFAAVEGLSTFKRGAMETKRHQIDDARNELEKAYGPLYTLLNKASKMENSDLWLDFEERRKIDEIMATYPFMFPSKITEFWQQKIRNLKSMIETSDLKHAKIQTNMDVYSELRKMINEEYALRVKNYRELLVE